MNSLEILTLPRRCGVAPQVLLRWGVERGDLEALCDLHDAAFPVKYGADYYDWLLSDSCVAVVAYTTPNCIRLIRDADENVKLGSEHCHGDGAAHDELLRAYSVLVGLCIGQVAHGRRSDGRLMVSPIGYLSSFAVDKRMQCRGLGELLLNRFLSYMFFDIPVQRDMFLDYSPPNLMSVIFSFLRSSLAGANGQLYNWWSGKRKNVANKNVIKTTDTGDSDDFLALTTPSTPDVKEQRGVSGVWLHCLASDARLIQYYLKRGFTRVAVDSKIYKFGGAYHDGMLLLCRRDYFTKMLNSLDDKKNEKRATATATTATTLGSLHRFMLKENCTADLEAPNDSCLEDADIVDVVLSTDYNQLRNEWKSSVGGNFGFLGHLVSSAGVLLYTIQTMVVSAWFAILLQIGFQVSNEDIHD